MAGLPSMDLTDSPPGAAFSGAGVGVGAGAGAGSAEGSSILYSFRARSRAAFAVIGCFLLVDLNSKQYESRHIRSHDEQLWFARAKKKLLARILTPVYVVTWGRICRTYNRKENVG